MKNIERFNLYAAHIFGVLYEQFPVPRMLHGREIVSAVRSALDLSDDEAEKQRKVATHTLRWLQDTGYIRAYGNDENRTFVLEPKAFEAMAAALPVALRGKEGSGAPSSIGEKLADAAKGVGTEVSKETKKQVATQLVGQVIGHVIRTVSG